jgi:hypothetical protein
VLQVPDVTLKMSTALEGKPLRPAAQGMRLAHAISKPNSAHSTITLPNPHNTQRERCGNTHGNTYQRHQRRSRLRDSAAMWLQVDIDLC